MVPTNFSEKAASEGVEIMQQGSWERLARPSMLRTDSEAYDKYAALFYQAQREVYGDISDYYAVDPFHEGGIRPADLSDSIISREVLDSMLKEDPDAVWMIQAWHDNPTDAQLEGLGQYREDHAIILDLTATDQRMRWKPTNEFKGTSWIYCVLDNYGGNPSLHGELTALSEEIPEALAEAKHMKGIGITSEALEHDPVYYELLYEMGWETAPIDLDQWLYDYAVGSGRKRLEAALRNGLLQYARLPSRRRPDHRGIRAGVVLQRQAVRTAVCAAEARKGAAQPGGRLRCALGKRILSL